MKWKHVTFRSGLIAMLGFFIVFASACNSKGSNETPKAEEGPPQVSTEPVTLKLALSMNWLGPGEFETYIEGPVKKRYPHISFQVFDMAKPEFSLDKILAGGEIPDIVMTASPIMYRFLGFGLEDNIEPLIKKFHFDLSKLNPAAVESVKTASGFDYLIGLPWTMHFSALYYNKDIFDRFGVAYPKDGLTWEQTRELAVKLTRMENGVQYRGLEPDKATRLAGVLGYGFIDPVAEKATVNNDNWKRIFEFMKSVYDIPGNNQVSNMNHFSKEKVLAMYPTVNIIPNLKDSPDLNWDMAQYPSFPERPGGGMQVDEWIFHITKQSKHKDQAFQVIQTVLSEEVQMEVAKNARFPVYTGSAIESVFGTNLSYTRGKHLKAAFMSKPANALPVSKYDAFAEGYVTGRINEVIKGEKDINTILRETEEAINKHIADTRGK
jgi:multiple sugar transport system substrate-binding protein